ncbi:DEAD/DEAH box helicase [Xenorhabdus japonica]|uniref:Helicase conserved C-terminal domain-containing protein n=1 Tax=Xenorhabdus japonica TaxID=53341 RepID=A0A1I5DLY8_9GAMM|nr:DEAD/DEAH box helicase [Xenorhabdus japonica]SFO00295.1 Helicase conserved C-terminal domain-containing protein [Xenorhabdus japonica]
MSAWYQDSKNKLNDPSFTEWDNFLISLINKYNEHSNESLVQDIVIRALERKDEMPCGFILDHILGELGLYPYVDKESNTSKDKFRRSIFTTPQDEEKTFHIRQAEVFHRIMSGENVILSAPTSFGKSLIIEALVASNEFNNIVIVVPTIALIDELKKKLFKYREQYKIVTQVSQKPSERNVFILTQERVLEYGDLDSIDFFIIDEFYKLAPVSKDDERCDRLNLAFRALYAKCKRFYMLGPKINGLVSGIEDELRCTFLKFDSYATVATNEFYYPLKTTGKDVLVDEERDGILNSILTSIGRKEQTVIYCKSPKRVSSLMYRLLSAGLLTADDTNDNLATWLAENFHSDWSLVDGVKHGIAYHHAQLPRAVGALIVDLFNESKINILVCTSTLIEGVNTNAKNIVIYDDCITKKTKLDMFTFNNISGRSGRMFEHFVGNVYIFGDKPQVELPFIDMPVVTQSENASESLLLHLGADVNEENKGRVKKFYDQKVLPMPLLLKHQGIDPNQLIKLAEELIEKCNAWNSLMCWDSIYPTSVELRHLSNILFKHFNISSMGGGTVRSASQLHRKLLDIINKVDDKDLILQNYSYWNGRDKSYSVDDSVQAVFNFKKNLVNYNLPKIIYAISDVQEVIFKRFEYPFGDYKPFAASLENFYYPAAINSLEEFGIPNQVAKKFVENNKNKIADIDSIDSVIDFLIASDEKSYPYLSEYELGFVKKALSYM